MSLRLPVPAEGLHISCNTYYNKHVTWSGFMVSMDNNWSIEYERMSSEYSTAEGSVGVSKSKILVKLENGKV